MRAWAALFLLALTACGRNGAGKPESLYTGRAFVTGQDERFRAIGFAQSLPDALAKVSGDPALLSDPRVATLTVKAASFVESYSYRDYMEDLPIGDEQGTRDRPYFLTVTFKQQAIDEILRTLGRSPWTANRRPVAVFVGVDKFGRDFVLDSDGASDMDERNSLTDAAWIAGLPIHLPLVADAERLHLNVAGLKAGGTAGLAAGDEVLVGLLNWDKGSISWHADWRLNWRGATHHWTIRAATYDEAFRNAMGGAAQIMSGHGEPSDVIEPTKQG